MSGCDWFEWKAARKIVADDPPFYALIAAALMRADTFNARRLRTAFPDVCADVQARYDAPGGYLASDSETLIRNTAGDAADAILERLQS